MSSHGGPPEQRVFRPLPRVHHNVEHTEAPPVTVESLGNSIMDTLIVDDAISEVTYRERDRPPTYHSFLDTTLNVDRLIPSPDDLFSTRRESDLDHPLPSIGQPFTIRDDYGNQSGNTATGNFVNTTHITSLGYLPPCSSEQNRPEPYTTLVHSPTQAITRDREANTMPILSPVRGPNYDTVPINTASSSRKTPSRSTLSFSLTGSKSYTKYINKMDKTNIPLTGKPLAYMQSNLLDTQNHFPLWKHATATTLQPGDVGIFSEDGSFQSYFNIFLTRQQNFERFDQEPPSGFEPFRGINVVSSRTSFGFTNRTPGFGSFDRTYERYGSHSRARFEFRLVPRQCEEIEAALIFFDDSPSWKHNALPLFAKLTKEEGVDYLKAQVDNWYQYVSSQTSQEVKNTHLLLIETTYTSGPCGQVLYQRDRNRPIPTGVIRGVCEPRIHTDGQRYNYGWSVVGDGSGQTWAKNTSSENQGVGGPEEQLCIGISALTLKKKKKLF